MRSFLRSCLAILALAVALAAQSKPPALSEIYVGSDLLAHLVDETGKDTAIPKESDQEAASEPKLAPDNRIAGWRIETENCCTSYPIPTRLLIYRDNRKLMITPGQMIYDWHFEAKGTQVVISVGPVHGAAPRHLLLYNTTTGRQLKEWIGDPEATPPDWAAHLIQ